MLIGTRLRLIAALPAVVILAIGVGLWSSWKTVDRARAALVAAEQIRRAIAEQDSLMQEYLLYGGGRVEAQLRASQQAMSELLSRQAFALPEDRQSLSELLEARTELQQLMALLFQSAGQSRNLIAGALLVKSQHLRLQARQLAERQQLNVVEIQRQTDQVVVVSLVLLAGFSVALLWLLARRLARGVKDLGTRIDMVRSGRLHGRVPVTGNDELSQLATSFNDMIDRVNAAEKALRDQAAALRYRTVELEAANADLESFSYSVSHDLRAPLRAIDGYSAIIRKSHASNLDEEGRRLFQVVSDNAVKMGQLIDDILVFSRAGRHELIITPVDMRQLVQEVWHGLEAQRAARRIELRIADLPAACGDPTALRQVLNNLLGNAVKFTRGRDPAVIEVAGQPNADDVHYSVRDNGVGFDMAYVGKLFVMFQRLHGMEEFEGTGVGLAIVKRYIAKHGGRVWAEGRPDEGATFWFTLAPADTCTRDKESDHD